MSDLTPNEKTADAPIAEAVNEQLAPRKKGFYTWKAVLVPTLGLHWLLTGITYVLFFLGSILFDLVYDLGKLFGMDISDEVFMPILILLSSALIIWVGIHFGRNLVLRTKVPVSWAKRWLPLLTYPLFTLIVVAVCMVLSEGFGGRDCWNVYYWINIYAFFIVYLAAYGNAPEIIFLANLVCFLPCILSFAFYQRRLEDLKPMPKPVRIILLTLILAGLAEVGYGHYKNFDHYNSSMVYDM